MTVARTSQVVVEVLRTNTAVVARVSQVVVEALRPNAEPRAENVAPQCFVVT